ncbi:HEPN/Toprim-associated domain-containing protein [Mangrovibacterium diazotrophicum]|uniref:HEPN/Toprim N-terminal domain-containing protein n=1 Tax=Mangrovibacterium diazotrophicum TaxID=1261403 RepID=A0A419VY56_9BACT|nr:HEPN/Toprim-associated domain-containing protein [Mangrovibacterium diazotrophicum]RKD88146.1 hypothetical protein BC643_3289 [Mangrovibacterium diazotrophicum]
MGSYCELYIKDYPIATTKNEIDPFLLSLFQTSDLNVFERKIGDRIQVLYGRENEEEEEEKAIQYFNSAKNIRDRLNVMGFTLTRTIERFEESKEESLVRLRERIEDKTFNDSDRMNKILTNEIQILENNSFDDFIEAVKEIFEHNYGFAVKKENLPDKINPIIPYLLDYGYGLDRFPYDYDQRTLLRALLEATEPDAIITYDITELLESGYYEGEPEEVYDEVIGNLTFDYELGEKFLILTEGTSDINILRDSLELLYPHLTGYYSFMDFGVSNASGSASSLVASIKSFVGADIKNKVIALFDNDTAAESAISGLSKTKIPPNIKIKQYPIIDIAKNYPTIGPTGITNMDINRLACSIEMYLGQDILSQKEGLMPIQWKGYDSKLKKYQGEIIDKTKVQKDFKKKIKECKEDRNKIKDEDWREMHDLLQMIFNTFNE